MLFSWITKPVDNIQQMFFEQLQSYDDRDILYRYVKDCQVDEQMLNVQNKNSSYFVEWIPNNIKVR